MAVNKVKLSNGETLIDISGDTVTPETLAEGATAHDKSGARITGTMKGGGVSVQSDWNQTDDTAADFIKNKPFGDELVEILPLSEVPIEYSEEDGAGTAIEYTDEISAGDTLEVYWDGVVYTCPVKNVFESTVFGNLMYFELEDSGEPFLGVIEDGTILIVDFVAEESLVRNISISCIKSTKVPDKYLPNIGTTFYVHIGDDPYMYVDAELTVKVTAFEALSALANGIVSLYDPMFQTRMSPLYALFYQPDVRAVCMYYGEETTFYTAEYTP